MWVSASPARYPDDEAKGRFFKRLQDQASLVPGVERISSSSESWFGLLNMQFNIESNPLPNGDENVRYSAVAPNYFTVLKAQIRTGRDFNDQDDLRAPPVAIINETLARRYFPDGQPIGKRIVLGYLGRRLVREVVGVSSDVKQEELGSATKPEMYVPMQQIPWFGTALIVRTTGDPMRLKKDLQAAIWQVDKDLPVSGVETVEQHLSNLRAEPRLYTLLLGVFAVIALLLASIGIYGVMSYSVTERTHEIGIRMALGAGQADVLGFVIKQGLTLTMIGLAIGVAVSLALTRLMESLLFGVSSTDPLTFVVISLLLAIVSIFATYLPARRATRVDPMIALRYE